MLVLSAIGLEIRVHYIRDSRFCRFVMPLLNDRQLSARTGQPAWCSLAQAVAWVAFDLPPLNSLIEEQPRSSPPTEAEEILVQVAKRQLHAMILTGHLPLSGRYCDDERIAPFADQLVNTISPLPNSLLSTLPPTCIDFESNTVSPPLDVENPPEELVHGEDYSWPIWADVRMDTGTLLKVFPSAVAVPEEQEGRAGRPVTYPKERLWALAAVVYREEGDMPLDRLAARIIEIYAIIEEQAPSGNTVKDNIRKHLASADTAYRRWRDAQR